jgi:hypothetical protein
MPRLAIAQPRDADFARHLQEDHEIEQRHERIAPAVDPAAQHPVGARQKHLVHQPQAVLRLSQLAIGRRGRSPQVVVGVVMRKRERVGERAAERRHARAGCTGDVDTTGLHGIGRARARSR